MLWSRKVSPTPDRGRVGGLDLTATRARAAAVGGGTVRPVPLDAAADELPLAVAGDRRTPEVGRAGVALLRKLPHAAVAGFLPAVGQPVEFTAGRHTLTADAFLELAFARVRDALLAEADAVGLVLPSYLTPPQAARVTAAAARARLPLGGTASAPLAIAAHRAGLLLDRRPAADPDDPAEGVIRLRPAAAGPGSVVVVDADDHALTAAAVEFDRAAARVVASAAWPRAGLKAWADRLLDAVADRCVRQCRRDPRDSADAEQVVFEQLGPVMDKARTGLRVTVTVRAASWYQDVAFGPDEFDALLPGLARATAEGLREFVGGAGLAVPPRAVWLTPAVGRLPGLARGVFQTTPESTAVEVLPASAAAHAAAALVPRWQAGAIPRAHLDGAIPLAAEATPTAEGARTGRG